MKKILTLFARDWNGDRRYVLPEVTPGCEWVIEGEGTPTRKYDGTCLMYAEDGWWARRDVKPGKNLPEVFRELERDDETGKIVGWGDANESGFVKYLAEALADGQIVDSWPVTGLTLGATYELIGPRVNGNPEQVNCHILIRHGYMSAADQDTFRSLPRDFDGLAAWLHANPYEGIVWHHPDGRMCKIKRRDFRSPE